MRCATDILIDECGGLGGAIRYCDRIAAARGPLADEYWQLAAALRGIAGRDVAPDPEDSAPRRPLAGT